MGTVSRPGILFMLVTWCAPTCWPQKPKVRQAKSSIFAPAPRPVYWICLRCWVLSFRRLHMPNSLIRGQAMCRVHWVIPTWPTKRSAFAPTSPWPKACKAALQSGENERRLLVSREQTFSRRSAPNRFQRAGQLHTAPEPGTIFPGLYTRIHLDAVARTAGKTLDLPAVWSIPTRLVLRQHRRNEVNCPRRKPCLRSCRGCPLPLIFLAPLRSLRPFIAGVRLVAFAGRRWGVAFWPAPGGRKSQGAGASFRSRTAQSAGGRRRRCRGAGSPRDAEKHAFGVF